MNLIIFLLATQIQALENGGASDLEEYQKIQSLAPSFQAQCPVDQDLKKFSKAEIARVTANLLNNETGCKAGNMMEWDSKAGEFFPSIGLPHVVGFPVGARKVVDESFPRFWQYLQQNYKGTTRWPDLKLVGESVPWKTKKEFETDPVVKDLNRFLLDPDVMELQGQFAVQRATSSIGAILAANSLDPNPRVRTGELCSRFKNLLKTPQGLQAIVDYVNWKGEGIHYSEQTDTKHIRWGLKQVLENIGTVDPKNAHLQFADAASRALAERSSDDSRIKKSMPGLQSRIESTYRKGGINVNQCPLLSRSGSGSQGAQVGGSK